MLRIPFLHYICFTDEELLYGFKKEFAFPITHSLLSLSFIALVSAAPCLTSLLQSISVKRHITTFERRLNDPHGGAQVRDNLYSMEDWHVNPWKHNRNRNTVVAGIGIPRPSLSISRCCWSC